MRSDIWRLALSCLVLWCGAASAQTGQSTPSGEGHALLGGYIDHELFWNEQKKTFDQHRLVPFIYAEVDERIHVMAEIEFEHGGVVKGDKESDGEIKIEFAVIDIAFSEALTYRAGVVLAPVGGFNIDHDSPRNDLTNRPLVDRQIIPTTLSESGMGLYGTLYPGEAAVVDYEVYLVNGFSAEAAANLRDGRGSLKADNNEQKSLTGRLAYSPSLGVQVAGSFHVGAYDDAGDHVLGLYALDANVNRGPFEVRGEYAAATVDGAEHERRWGYYAQLGYHFGEGLIRAFPESICTASLRYDAIDLGARDQQRVTLGLNWRPIEKTVVKLDYEFYESGAQGNGLVLSVASYF